MCEKAKLLPVLPAIRYGAFGILIGCVIVLSISFSISIFIPPRVFDPLRVRKPPYFDSILSVESVQWIGDDVIIACSNNQRFTGSANSFFYMRSLDNISRFYIYSKGRLLQLGRHDYTRYEDFVSHSKDIADINRATAISRVN